MLLDDVDVTNGTIGSVSYVKKLVEHQYDRSDTNHVTEMGAGITRITVTGVFETAAQRDALAEKCAQSGTKQLYYPSAQGETVDRYFVCYTSALSTTPITASVYRYEFTCLAADPFPYVSTTDAHVWNT